MPTAEWSQSNLYLPEEGSDLPGLYDLDYAPYMWGIFAAFDDPNIPEIVAAKAAQIGWTFGLIAYLGKRIDTDPGAIVAMFAAEGAAREFNDEKLETTVNASPALSQKIDVSASRKAGNRALFKKFPGGFLKLVGSNAIRSLKSTPAKLVIVEEPDDSKENVKEQGDAILLLWERTKRARNGKRILGGTPSIKGLSRVLQHLEQSDKRVLPIECHECGESHVLDWENVSWMDSDDSLHPVYGKALPETSVYVCPHCAVPWDDYQRKENIRGTVRRAVQNGDPNCGWVATAEYRGVAGFCELGELYSCLPGAGVAELVKDYIDAEHRASQGDENGKIVFVNSKLGRGYEFKDDQADAETLKNRAEDYPELVCPRGGLLITVGIDIQHDRVAVIIRAWGRGEESWLMYWGEIQAGGSTVDKKDPVWDELDKLIFSPLKHESGSTIFTSAVSIDSSDGTTSDAVYHWVRTRSKKYQNVLVMAVKGSSAQKDPEIFVTPTSKSVDHINPKKVSKADKYGVKVYIVGTNKGKDWLSSHLKLEGVGPGRFHFYKDVRADYFDQVTSEVKAPHRSIRNKKVWQLKAGQRNEAFDCEDYALHAARARRIHLKKPSDWDFLEQQLVQTDLLSVDLPLEDDKPSNKPESAGLSMADLGRILGNGD